MVTRMRIRMRLRNLLWVRRRARTRVRLRTRARNTIRTHIRVRAVMRLTLRIRVRLRARARVRLRPHLWGKQGTMQSATRTSTTNIAATGSNTINKPNTTTSPTTNRHMCTHTRIIVRLDIHDHAEIENMLLSREARLCLQRERCDAKPGRGAGKFHERADARGLETL